MDGKIEKKTQVCAAGPEERRTEAGAEPRGPGGAPAYDF